MSSQGQGVRQTVFLDENTRSLFAETNRDANKIRASGTLRLKGDPALSRLDDFRYIDIKGDENRIFFAETSWTPQEACTSLSTVCTYGGIRWNGQDDRTIGIIILSKKPKIDVSAFANGKWQETRSITLTNSVAGKQIEFAKRQRLPLKLQFEADEDLNYRWVWLNDPDDLTAAAAAQQPDDEASTTSSRRGSPEEQQANCCTRVMRYFGSLFVRQPVAEAAEKKDN